MQVKPAAGEPEANPWRPQSFEVFVASLLTSVGSSAVLAVDGRSASGKSTISARIAAAVPGSVVVHTDDVAWHESFFDWDHLLRDGVLEPAIAGRAIAYRPPAWDRRQRAGAIVVPANTQLLIIEGVGASRRSLQPYLDASIWVQSDDEEARRRGILRDGGDQAAVSFWEEWDEAERPFLADDRPWERAAIVVCGTPELTGVPHDPRTEVLVGRSLVMPGSD